MTLLPLREEGASRGSVITLSMTANCPGRRSHDRCPTPELFNSALETGVRSVVLLNTAYPRAITHAAFKVALMLFCRERNRPHPGFLVLDTPLLTYRDPMKRLGDRLESDEQELRNSDLKQRFFDHLGHLGEKAQIIVLENVDPPEGVKGSCKVEVFTHDAEEGRQGLL